MIVFEFHLVAESLRIGSFCIQFWAANAPAMKRFSTDRG
jgi:hypothetical protein